MPAAACVHCTQAVCSCVDHAAVFRPAACSYRGESSLTDSKNRHGNVCGVSLAACGSEALASMGGAAGGSAGGRGNATQTTPPNSNARKRLQDTPSSQHQKKHAAEGMSTRHAAHKTQDCEARLINCTPGHPRVRQPQGTQNTMPPFAPA